MSPNAPARESIRPCATDRNMASWPRRGWERRRASLVGVVLDVMVVGGEKFELPTSCV